MSEDRPPPDAGRAQHAREGTRNNPAVEIRTLASRVVYENRWMLVREDRIEREDGSTGVYGVVDKHDYVVVIPRAGDSFFMVEQFRYPAKGRFWEFPQGSWEQSPGTAPERLARAELREETGLRAAEMRHLGHLYEAYGFCSQAFDVFLAEDCRRGAPAPSPEEQGMRIGQFDADELRQMIRTGIVRDGPSVAAYGLLQLG